jgi:hypothetical protein
MIMRTFSVVVAVTILAATVTMVTACASDTTLTEGSVRAVVEAHLTALNDKDPAKAFSYTDQDCNRNARDETGDPVRLQRRVDTEKNIKSRAEASGGHGFPQIEWTQPKIVIESRKVTLTAGEFLFHEAHARFRMTETMVLMNGKTGSKVEDVDDTLEVCSGHLRITHDDIKLVSMTNDGKTLYLK